jgi:uncharacterized membrane protein
MEKRGRVSKPLLFLFLLFFLFSLLQSLSPFFLPSGEYTNFSGIVGISDNDHIIKTIPFPWDLVYKFGDRLCHQKPERSFFINGNQMSFCSRCTAIWIGITFGLGIMLFFQVSLDNRFIYLILLSLIPIGMDGTGQLLGFWESTNIIRVITGLIIGIPVGIALGIIVDEIRFLYKSKTN